MIYANINTTKAGDTLVADDGFTCMKSGEHVVEQDAHGLFIRCAEGHHYLGGQVEDDTGVMIGLTTR